MWMRNLCSQMISLTRMISREWRECLQFFLVATNCLWLHFPFQVNVLKYGQYLHHEERNSFGATNAISNLALKVAKKVKSQLSIVFGVQGIVSVESIYDQIHNQWIVYQNQNIPETFYIKDEDKVAIGRKGGVPIFVGHVL